MSSVSILELARLLDDPIVVIDVGCRWGFSDSWRALGDRCQLIGFDPDAAECERLNKEFPGPSTRFVPVGLGAANGLATLHLTRDPGGISLYPPSEDAVTRHPGLSGGVTEGTMVVDLVTLDGWRAAGAEPPVDVIKLDTQGSELDILRGAHDTLASVRAVEVEVQFNELYDGVPLFADVDRYLRSQGFVLWRLRNLSHYAQAGVDRTWQLGDTQHFDDFTATFPTIAGQLYWANAFFVRQDVARPSRLAHWQQLVRDACISTVLGFHDLAELALATAAEVAPPDAAARLADAIAEAATEIRRHSERARTSTTLDRSHVIELGSLELSGGGWGPALRTDDGALRWSGPGRDAWIDAPFVLAAGTRIEVAVVAAMSAEILNSVRLEVNGRRVELTRSPRGRGVMLAGVVGPDGSGTRSFSRVMLKLSETLPWSAVDPSSADQAELGIAVTSFRFSPPGRSISP